LHSDEPARIDHVFAQVEGVRIVSLKTKTKAPAAAREPVVPDITGTVLLTQNTAGDAFVVIDRGTKSGVAVDMTFDVYRRSTYKGRVQVLQAAEEQCVARIVLEADGRTIEMGDQAATKL
jgi:hypothetical protein